MSFIIKRKINNATYIFEVTSYRDENGNPRNKRKCLGKLDNDGVLISSKKNLPAEINEVKTITKKFVIKD
ncbi:MAG: hypothetical protein IJM82_09230 [Synergistaceae bacterium]|nr:hypothetical protein [Synergistaceae bacterium]MBR0080271.1 hypothetical protein [Synergistaceae bacterium]MBR0233734.1 hypothetical protein [Synergistaceae bacterium]MBR0317598.1 hypothetical protein [Synergistaceae bacterium]